MSDRNSSGTESNRIGSDDARHARLMSAFAREGRPRTLSLWGKTYTYEEIDGSVVFIEMDYTRTMMDHYTSASTGTPPPTPPVTTGDLTPRED
jgi:hypothetical protein